MQEHEGNLKDGGRRFEVEITEDGVIGEIEAKIAFRDMPPEIQAYVREKVGTGHVRRVEKHERRGVARSGEFVPLDEPRIMYEVKITNSFGYHDEIQVASNGILELPAAVRRNIRARYPDARIREAEAEDDDGVLVFVVSLIRNHTPFHLTVLRNGKVIEKEEPVRFNELPKALQHLLKQNPHFTNAGVKALYRAETDAAVEEGSLVPRHDVTYIVQTRNGEKQREYRFDGRGRLVKTLEAGEREEDEDDDED